MKVEAQARSSPASFGSRGLFYLDKNNYEFALDDFNEAIRLEPHSVDGYWNRAQAHENASYRGRAGRIRNSCSRPP